MSDPYGIARQRAQANNMLKSLRGSKVTNMPVRRKVQPFKPSGSTVTNMPVAKPRFVPDASAVAEKKKYMEKMKMQSSAEKMKKFKNNQNKVKADLEQMRKNDYSRVIQKRMAKMNRLKTVKKMVNKKSVKGSYRIGNGPNRASY